MKKPSTTTALDLLYVREGFPNRLYQPSRRLLKLVTRAEAVCFREVRIEDSHLPNVGSFNKVRPFSPARRTSWWLPLQAFQRSFRVAMSADIESHIEHNRKEALDAAKEKVSSRRTSRCTKGRQV